MKSSVYSSIRCDKTDCTLRDKERKECTVLLDTDFKGKSCPFHKPKKKKSADC